MQIKQGGEAPEGDPATDGALNEHTGFQLCDACMQALLVESVRQDARRSAGEHKLTQREEEILRLIGTGLTNKEIARRLAISDKTVKTHLHHVYVKLHRSGRYKAFLSRPGTPLAQLAAASGGALPP
jgi:DNA-binding NarL/FixJ family response regulator